MARRDLGNRASPVDRAHMKRPLDGPADVNVELLDRVSLDGGERTGTLFAAVLDGSVDVNVETLDGALDRGVLAGTLLLLEVLVPE